MKVNSINFANYSIKKAPISFGEEHWIGGAPDYQKDQNIRVESFFENAKEFKESADCDVKHINKLAEKAFTVCKKAESQTGDSKTLKMNGIEYDIRCAKAGSTKIAVLQNGRETYRFYFDENAKHAPKTYIAKCENEDGEYTLIVKPDSTTYTEVEKRCYGVKTITYNKEGYTYTEKSSETSKDYDMAIVKKAPHKSESQYIEHVAHYFSEDTTCVYSCDPKTKNWSYEWK